MQVLKLYDAILGWRGIIADYEATNQLAKDCANGQTCLLKQKQDKTKKEYTIGERVSLSFEEDMKWLEKAVGGRLLLLALRFVLSGALP